MIIDRLAFLKAVTTCKPAIGSNSILEELAFLFSDGKSLIAYDDQIGIIVPFASDLIGGIRGALLLGMLDKSKATDIEIGQEQETEVLIKAGRARLKAALMPLERAPYLLPAKRKAKPFRLSMSFYEALKAVLPCLSTTATIPDQLGVALVLQGSLNFYATDPVTTAQAVMKHNCDSWPLPAGQRVILPTRFVEQLIKLGTDGTTLYLTKNDVLAETDKGIKLFARLVHSPKPHDFQRLIDEEMKNVQMFTLPKRLPLMLDRALVLLDGVEDRDNAVDLVVDDGVLHMTGRTKFEALHDSVKLDEMPKPARARVAPKRLKRVLEFAERIGFSEYGIVLAGKAVLYIVGRPQDLKGR